MDEFRLNPAEQKIIILTYVDLKNVFRIKHKKTVEKRKYLRKYYQRIF